MQFGGQYVEKINDWIDAKTLVSLFETKILKIAKSISRKDNTLLETDMFEDKLSFTFTHLYSSYVFSVTPRHLPE